MATREEIQAKHDELQAAMNAREAAQTNYEAALEPYRGARQALVDALIAEGTVEDEFEALIVAHEPPELPAVG